MSVKERDIKAELNETVKLREQRETRWAGGSRNSNKNTYLCAITTSENCTFASGRNLRKICYSKCCRRGDQLCVREWIVVRWLSLPNLRMYLSSSSLLSDSLSFFLSSALSYLQSGLIPQPPLLDRPPSTHTALALASLWRDWLFSSLPPLFGRECVWRESQTVPRTPPPPPLHPSTTRCCRPAARYTTIVPKAIISLSLL